MAAATATVLWNRTRPPSGTFDMQALADPTRRLLLDRLHARNGQTLGELCQHLEMTRQSATQHLGVLAAANLVATVRRGREKLHYLNPVPLQEIEERWIDKFERSRLQALRAVQRRAEEAMTDKPAARDRPRPAAAALGDAQEHVVTSPGLSRSPFTRSACWSAAPPVTCSRP